MEKNVKCYLGIDVSKSWFDLSFMKVVDHVKQTMVTERFDNNEEGIAKMDKLLLRHEVPFDANSLLVIENTGVYHRLLWEYCSNRNLPVHIGNAANIKWSFGITRGKNDVTDSKRLCGYCHKQAEDLKATAPLNPVLTGLKDLMTMRSMLIRQKNAQKAYLKELKNTTGKEMLKVLEKATWAALEGLEKSIADLEKQMQKLIKSDEKLESNYNLLLTVPGIGNITAAYLICCTNNFSGKASGKQLASYAGVVPFAETSGSSVRGKSKVHKMANKELKALLYMGAMTCIQRYPEFKQYYERKVAEGKNKMGIINAIKNKMLLRVVAVINKKEAYVENIKVAA